MKRSEMVFELQKLLSDYEDCKLDSKVADKVLKKMENCGMLPPGKFIIPYKGRHELAAIEQILKNFKWDKE